jgi:hypothetical protein
VVVRTRYDLQSPGLRVFGALFRTAKCDVPPSRTVRQQDTWRGEHSEFASHFFVVTALRIGRGIIIIFDLNLQHL